MISDHVIDRLGKVKHLAKARGICNAGGQGANVPQRKAKLKKKILGNSKELSKFQRLKNNQNKS